jgi:hypothetical protein
MSIIGAELMNVPFPEMVRNLGLGIAEAQHALDQASIRVAQMMAGFKLDASGTLVRDDSALIKLREDGPSVSLLSLGFTPTFYQFVDTVIELKMSVSMSKSIEVGVKAKVRSFCASVTASFSAKYQYSAEGSSLMRTKLVTVPAPAMFEQRIKEEMAIIDEENP